MEIFANLIDIKGRATYPARITIKDDRIADIRRLQHNTDADILPYVLPGFVDAHVHIESSMLVPSEFARLAVRHGTVATVSDPHEIANVMGVAGIDFMIDDGNKVPFKFFFGAPSCVPATSFESAGATIDSDSIARLMARDDIHYLAEMMNYPGVLSGDAEIISKLDAAKQAGKPIDGHAPGLTGQDGIDYAAAGITTDHECTTLAEAEHKLKNGMKIQIREGSAAKNFGALFPLIDRYPDSIMFCSDDKHPDDLTESHINALVRRSIDCGCELYNVLRAACINPVEHYGLAVGTLSVGDPADFIVVEDIDNWTVAETYIAGKLVAKQGESRIEPVTSPVINHFNCQRKTPNDFKLSRDEVPTRAIEAIDGSLVTNSITVNPATDADLATLVVVNRYRDAPVAQCFIRGFGIQRGAIASCVGHDSHNILAVGIDEHEICAAVNQIIDHRGGIAAVEGDQRRILPLPVAGIMTTADGDTVARQYKQIDEMAKSQLGITLSAPFMTLSFMALLVIPSLKLSDRGLFDAESFQFAIKETEA